MSLAYDAGALDAEIAYGTAKPPKKAQKPVKAGTAVGWKEKGVSPSPKLLPRPPAA